MNQVKVNGLPGQNDIEINNSIKLPFFICTRLTVTDLLSKAEKLQVHCCFTQCSIPEP